MTTTLPSNVTALATKQDELRVSDRMAAFLAEELLPLMAGFWPASANQLDANVRGVAQAWGSLLRGCTPQQIREVALEMAEDTDRQFAPRPAEVKAAILRRVPAKAPTPGLEISTRACEVCATVTVLQRDGSVTSDAVRAELALVVSEMRRRGVTVTGRIS